MNKRIEQIIEECTEYWTDKGDTYFDQEKFAKSIIQECISYIDSRDYSSGSEGIAEHFGIEE